MRILLVPSLLVISLLPAMAEMSKENYLNRSIYVPLEVKPCEHWESAMLYLSNLESEELQRVPLDGIFQFTFYPVHEKILPEYTIIKLTGTLDDQETFQHLTIYPNRILLSSTKSVMLDERVLKKLSFKIDVRYEKSIIHIKCKNHTKETQLAKNGN